MSDIAAVVSPVTVPTGAVTRRPILIDESDGRCEICAAHEPGLCDLCKEAIPVYENMGGSGYCSPKPSHYHLVMVEGTPGRSARLEELCLDCYRQRHAEAYPGLPLPV